MHIKHNSLECKMKLNIEVVNDIRTIADYSNFISAIKYKPVAHYVEFTESAITKHLEYLIVKNISNGGRGILAYISNRPVVLALIQEMPFETNIFGIKIKKIDFFSVITEYQNDLEIKNSILDWAFQNIFKKEVTIHSRANIIDFSTIHALESHSFKVMDTLLEFYKDIRGHRTIVLDERNINIQRYSSNMLDDLIYIAENTFNYGRYHSDPVLHDKAKDVYKNWTINSCSGRADEVLVAKFENQIVGFIICNIYRDSLPIKRGVIELIAVKQECQGMGIGSRLIDASLNWFNGKVDFVEIGTQANNCAAINLYSKKGFKTCPSSSIALHLNDSHIHKEE